MEDYELDKKILDWEKKLDIINELSEENIEQSEKINSLELENQKLKENSLKLLTLEHQNNILRNQKAKNLSGKEHFDLIIGDSEVKQKPNKFFGEINKFLEKKK